MPLLAPFAVALVTVLATTPLVRVLARRLGFVDRPASRKMHARPVPLGGGVALVAGIVAGGVASRSFELEARFPLAALGGLAVAVGLGLVDDRSPLRPGTKLAGQLLAASILVLGSGHPALPALHGLAVPLAIVGVVALMNACNFLDNMDGILGGIALVCASAYLVIARAGAVPVAAVAAATAGASAGFLAYNFAPARIFMGDAGSLALGYLLAALALGLIPPSLPARPGLGIVLVLGYPIFDLAFVTITRLRDRRKVWAPGKDHSSHRLNRLLMSPRLTALAIYGLSSMMAIAGLLVCRFPGPASVVAAGLGSAVLLALGLRLARVPAA
jgi:UDP-GlcNAc:undecaprenyl-phosphate GlcNAc-1-phosphate transferase